MLFPATKLALIVRVDIKMSKGKTAAQCAHAAVLCLQEAQKIQKKHTFQIMNSWLRQGQPKIVLRCDGGYEELMQLHDKAIRLGLISSVVRDAGRTQLTPNTVTVLGIGPALKEDIDKLISHLKLL